ncbi:MAG TPA: decarboxylating 6-phosphogluconate dehydrogenase [Acidimicrobiia bacterium]|nr:decarboxylating 6-phosphogluconate dehydrogenase [Acidimicrobiia bacterium]
MDLGMIGLGRMGANISERLVGADHRVVGFDLDREAMRRVAGVGARGAESLDDLVESLPTPRVVWIMVPAGDPVEQTIGALLPHLDASDIIIDGGNSYYRDTIRRAETCRKSGHHLIDVGTSGGIWGLEEGYSMMIGGEREPVERIRPLLETLAPSPDRGWGRVGPSGAGHFVKMIQNGIEYGLMEAYAEGFAILKGVQAFDLDTHQIAEIWRDGSVVRSWLLDLIAMATAQNPEMEGIAPWVPDSGPGRWTVVEAIDCDVPAPVISLSLLQRIGSRDEFGYADRLIAAMRQQFGGHAVKAKE